MITWKDRVQSSVQQAAQRPKPVNYCGNKIHQHFNFTFWFLTSSIRYFSDLKIFLGSERLPGNKMKLHLIESQKIIKSRHSITSCCLPVCCRFRKQDVRKVLFCFIWRVKDRFLYLRSTKVLSEENFNPQQESLKLGQLFLSIILIKPSLQWLPTLYETDSRGVQHSLELNIRTI